jgi:hypothetical protein
VQKLLGIGLRGRQRWLSRGALWSVTLAALVGCNASAAPILFEPATLCQAGTERCEKPPSMTHRVSRRPDLSGFYARRLRDVDSSPSRAGQARDLLPRRTGQARDLLPLTLDLVRPDWHEIVARFANRQDFGRYLKRRGYQPPKGALLISARIDRLLGKLAFEYVSLGDSGFRYSYSKRFFVASAIKLPAAVATLVALARKGFDGLARVRIRDADGLYEGTVREAYKLAVMRSSNAHYNWLIQTAGFDAVNNGFLSARYGMPKTVIQVRYGGKRIGQSLRSSPPVFLRQGQKELVLYKRYGRSSHRQCPNLETCTSLYELQETLRRVVLHDELQARDRLPVARHDLVALKAFLLQARNRLDPELSLIVGRRFAIHNSVGRVPGRSLVENAYLVAKDGPSARLLLAVLVPFEPADDPKDMVRVSMATLAGHAASFVLKRRQPAVPIIPAGIGEGIGVPLKVEIREDAEHYRLAVFVATNRQDRRDYRIEAWLDGKRLRSNGSGMLLEKKALESKGTGVVVVAAHVGRRLVGYRLMGLKRVSERQ